MSIDEKMLIIRRNDFLAQLTPDDYEGLDIAHNFIMADKNAFIYFDAQNFNKLFFVKEGYVKIGNIDDEGNEIVRDILQPGDVFGQITLERNNNMRGEFAQACRSDVSLCAFTIDDFERLLHVRPDLAVHFSKKIGRKQRHIENRLLNLLQKDVRTRLLYFFWTLLEQNAKPGETTSLTLSNYLTHEDIARLTGTSRQTVTTLISQFALEGLLDVDRRNIVIHDVKSLQKLAKVG
jgi:CRP/FNR family transcriptional regulator